jgi:hypothetical protein
MAESRLSWLEMAIVSGTAVLALLGQRVQWPVALAGLREWLVPAVFLYAPLLAVLIRDRDFRAIGVEGPDRAKAMLDFFSFLLLILPLFLLAWWAIFRFGFKTQFQFRFPSKLAGLVAWQFLGVALPEEVFFRGWLQGRLNQRLGRAWPIPGAMIGPGLFLSALVFALAHLLVKPEPIRLLVFFPALLFGYFREREGSVLVPILAHALGNICFLLLQAGAGA